ncbi:MAG: YraN family protein [Actinomycetaceae bacterium]|nr:YraN family protein [Actinomycetaceae bacterium]
MNNQERGRLGEDLAVEFLLGAEYVVIDRNWRCRHGEVDIIARDVDGSVVFIEVKLRSSVAFGTPAAAINLSKLRRMWMVARTWAHEHLPYGTVLRVDLIAVVLADGEAPRIEHRKGLQ